jgi:formamidopyrimidine-DNA glycosylase
MPELPDVETLRQYLQATSLHQEIADVDLRADVLLEETEPARLADALVGRNFESTHRHGKYLFVALDDGDWLVLHFGMTGELQYFKDIDQDPEYDRLLISFTNGYHLAYIAPRKLGEVEVIGDPEQLIEDRELGPDVKGPDFTLDTFKRLLSSRRGMIKTALMDQQLMAGIGNVYSDEILFQARVHPRTKVKDLDEEKREELYQTMHEVLDTAIDHQAKPSRFPDSYLTPHHHQDGICPLCGEPVERVTVGGRSAYFCPNRQGQEPGPQGS